LVPATASAQWVCKVTLPEFAGDTQFFSWSTFSCIGNNCTASVLANNTANWSVYILFKRTNDGGRTWTTQDPGLPNQFVAYANRITKIEQIDSLNVVAIGDTTLVLRTFDGGATWQQQHLPTTLIDLTDVSFANPEEGIIVAGGYSPSMFTTIDGGQNWSAVDFWQPGLCQCHAYGNGKFRVFKYDFGETYYTSDNWKTVDSTKGSIDRADSGVLGSCNFSDGDTLIEYGNVLLSGVTDGRPDTRVYPLIVRSTDAGISWKIVFEDTNTILGEVMSMSSLNRDTIVAGLSIGRARVLFSSDRGATWSLDTMLFDTSDNLIANARMYGVALNSKDELVASMGGSNTVLVLGERATASVQTYQHLAYYSYLYPNPATKVLNVISEDRLHPIRVFDILGREVLRGQLDQDGHCRLDVSSLAGGMYIVMLEHDGLLLPVSRVAIL
jgi:hypothetical protein